MPHTDEAHEEANRKHMEVLASRIRTYWLDQGHVVRVWVEKRETHCPAVTHSRGDRVIHYPSGVVVHNEIRSELVNGLPQGRKMVV